MHTIPGYEYLENPDRSIQHDIYNLETYKHFNTDEFEHKTRPIDWVSSSIVKSGIEMIADLSKVASVKVDFGAKKQTEYFDKLMNDGWNVLLEQAVINQKVYGDSYIQLAVEDSYDTRDTSFNLKAYTLDPRSVYADYDKRNPQRGAKKYTLIFEKEIMKKEYVLLVSYAPGYILYEAFENEKRPRQVDPTEFFGEFFSDDLKYTQEGLSYIYNTDLNYNLLTHFSNTQKIGEFYGCSDITTPVISKLQLLERMYNLGDFAVTNNAMPERVYSTGSSKIIDKAINELREGTTDSLATLPDSFLSRPEATGGKIRVSQKASMIRKMVKNNSMIYAVDNGEGEDRYIVNPYKLDDLYEMIDRTQKEIYSDLYISPLLFDTSLNTGQLTGVAMKRLMTRTIEHVNTLRAEITPRLAQFAYTSLQLAKNAGLENATFSDLRDLPKIQWEPITEEEIQDTVMRYKEALAIKPTEELKNKAITELTDLEIEEVENMVSTPSIAETLNQRINGGNNN